MKAGKAGSDMRQEHRKAIYVHFMFQLHRILVESKKVRIVKCAPGPQRARGTVNLRPLRQRTAFTPYGQDPYASSNIRVNAICPGYVDTPMMDRFTGGTPEGRQNVIDNVPAGRPASPEEIAGTVLWMAPGPRTSSSPTWRPRKGWSPKPDLCPPEGRFERSRRPFVVVVSRQKERDHDRDRRLRRRRRQGGRAE